MRLVCIDHLATQRCGRGLYRALGESGEVDLTLVTPPLWRDNYRDIPVEPAEHGAPYRLEVLPVWFPGKSNRCLHPGLGRLLRRIRPDAVFVQSEPEDLLLAQVHLVRALHRLRFKSIFITWRNLHYSRFDLPYKFAWVYGCMEPFGLRCGDRCFAFNQAGRDTLGARGYRRVDVIPPAIDTGFFAPTDATPRRRALGLRRFTVGYFGRFVEEKGVGLLLEATAGLVRPVQLLLVGNGPARAAWLEKARRLGLNESVVHVPSVLRSDVPEYLCACDAVVLPSYATAGWKEQFGRILVEAMGCGVPVVGSDSGEIPHVIGDAGLVFPEKDVGRLRDALARLIEQPRLRAEFAARGRARAQSRFSCAAVAAAWLGSLRRLLDNHVASSSARKVGQP